MYIWYMVGVDYPMNLNREAKIEKILLEAGIVNRIQLESMKGLQVKTAQTLESILVSEGIINQKDLLCLLAKSMGVEFIDPGSPIIHNTAINKVNGDIVSKYRIFPFDVKNNLLCVAMKNPDDLFTIDEIKVFTQMEIKPYLADSKWIDMAIAQVYGRDQKSNPPAVKEHRNSTGIERKSKISSIINRNAKPATEGPSTDEREIKTDKQVTKAQAENNILDITPREIIKDSLKLENITEIYVDTVNQCIKVTLTVKYP